MFGGVAWAPPEPVPVSDAVPDSEAASPEYELPPLAGVEPSATALEVEAEPTDGDLSSDGVSEGLPWMSREAEPVSEAASEQAPGADTEDDAVVFAADVVETGEVAEIDVSLVPSPADFARLEATANVVESLNLGFHLGSAVERIATAAGQGSEGIPALRQAAWLIERYVALLERRPIGADLHLSAVRLARTGDTLTDLKALAAALDDAYADGLRSDVATPVAEPSSGDAGTEQEYVEHE